MGSLILAGCGSDNSSSASSTTPTPPPDPSTSGITISGVGQNSYLDGSSICIDVNRNDVCDINETTSMISRGSYSFDINESQKAYPLLIEIKSGNKLYGDDKSTVEETVSVPRVIRALSVSDYETLGLSPTALVTNQFSEELRNQVDSYGYDINTSYQNYITNTPFDPLKDYQIMSNDANTTIANNYKVAKQVSQAIAAIKKTFMEKLSDSIDSDEKRVALNQIISQQIESLKTQMVTTAEDRVSKGVNLSESDIATFTTDINNSIGSDAAGFIAQAVAEVKIQQEVRKRYTDNPALQEVGDKDAIADIVKRKMEELKDSIIEEAKKLGNNPDVSSIDTFLNEKLGTDFADTAEKEVKVAVYEDAIRTAVKKAYNYDSQDEAVKKAILSIGDTIVGNHKSDIVTAVQSGDSFDVATLLSSEDLSKQRLSNYILDAQNNSFMNLTLYDNFNGTDLNNSLWILWDSNGTLDVDGSATLTVEGDGATYKKESIKATSKTPISGLTVTLKDTNVTANQKSASVGVSTRLLVTGENSESYNGYTACLMVDGGEDNTSKYQVQAIYKAIDENGSEVNKTITLLYPNVLDSEYKLNISVDDRGVIRYSLNKQNGDKYFAEINTSTLTPNIQAAAIDGFKLSVGVNSTEGFAKGSFDDVRINQKLTRLNAIEGELNMENEGIKDRICGNESCLKEKYTTMSASPFSFYRGSAGLYYQDIAFGQIVIPSPWVTNANLTTWIQGDAHMQNLGYYNENNSYEDKSQFSLNDFDESYIAPFYWDTIRFATSIRLMVDYMNGVNSGEYNGSLGSRFEPITDTQVEELVQNFVNYYMHYLKKAATDSSATDGVIDSFKPESSFLNPKVATANGDDVFMEKGYEKSKDRYIDKDSKYKMPDTYDSVSHGDDYENKSPIAKYTLAFATQSEGKFDLKNSDLEDINDSTTPTYAQLESVWNAQIMPDFGTRDKDMSEGNFTIKDIVRVLHKGTGSLGLDRFYVLTEGLTTSAKDDLIFQVKEEDAPVYLKYFNEINSSYPIGSNPASVVIEGYKKMTNKTDDYLSAIVLSSRNYLVGTKMNADYSFDPDNFGDKKYYIGTSGKEIGSAVDDLNNYIHYAAKAYAYAHARSNAGFASKADAFMVNDGEFVKTISSLSDIYASQVEVDWQLFNGYILPSVDGR